MRLPGWSAEALVLTTAAAGPLAFGGTEIWSVCLLQILAFASFFACCWNGLRPSRSPLPGLLLPAMLLLVALGAFQWANARSPLLPGSLVPFTAAAYATKQTLLLWSAYAAFLWSAGCVLRRDGAPRRLMALVVGLGAFIALVGLLQKGQGNAAYYGLRAVRQGHPFGPYPNYNHAASLLLLAAFLGAGAAAARLPGIAKSSGVGALSDALAKEALLWSVVALAFAGVLATGSRGAFNAACATIIAGVGVAAARWGLGKTGGKALAAVCLAAAGAYAAYLAANPKFFGSLLTTPDASTSYRLSMYRSGLAMAADFPLWGIGAGAVAAAFPAYKEFWEHTYTVDHVHSDWLELLLQTGAAGFLVVLVASALSARQALRAFSREPSRRKKLLMAGALSALMAFLVHCLVEFSFQIPGNAFCFFAVAALLCELASEGGDVQAPPLRWPGCAAAVALAAASVLPAAASRLVARSEALKGPARMRALEAALRLEDTPANHYRAGYWLLESATAGPEETGRLREAFGHAARAFAAAPLDPAIRKLQANVLWRLERKRDAAGAAS